MERAKRKRYFEQELFENLVTFGCNPQWHELMETCQKIGCANDASNLTRAVEMFLASEKTNPSEYPVDYICKHGDLEMFKTFIKKNISLFGTYCLNHDIYLKLSIFGISR